MTGLQWAGVKLTEQRWRWPDSETVSSGDANKAMMTITEHVDDGQVWRWQSNRDYDKTGVKEQAWR